MNKKEWKTHIAAYHKSGLSKRAFARESGLVYSQFLYWIRQLSAAPAEPDFVPVDVAVSAQPLPTDVLGILELPNGSRLVIKSPELIMHLPGLFQ